MAASTAGGYNPNRNADGTFANGPRTEADFELPGHGVTENPWTRDAPALSAPETRLATAMQRLHKISPTSYTEAPWICDDTFTCDGGAVAAALVAREIGIPAQLHVGLYWHTDAELRADFMGEHRGDYDTDEEWHRNLRQIKAEFMDEHHHWVTLHPGERDELRVDPNGPLRHEPHLFRTRQSGAYEDRAEYLVYDPYDDLNDIADQIYPGLRDHVMRALATTP